MTTTIDTNRLAQALIALATSPQAIDTEQQVLAKATQIVTAAPNTGFLSGKKTYIISALGVLSTLVTVGATMAQHGGLTLTGWCAAIMALVTSGSFATLRSALNGHYGALSGMLLDIGQQIVLTVAQSAQPAVSGASPGDPAMDRAAGN